MANLDLEFVGLKNMEGSIFVNGSFVRLKKNRKTKTYYCNMELKEKKCEVVVYKTHHYFGKNWLWWNLLFFFVSLFGLFDARHSKKCLVLDGRFNLNIEKDTKIVFRRKDFEDGGQFVSLETDANVEEISNIQYYDKEAKKKHAIMNKVKIGATIGVFLLAILLIMFV